MNRERFLDLKVTTEPDFLCAFLGRLLASNSERGFGTECVIEGSQSELEKITLYSDARYALAASAQFLRVSCTC